MASNKQELKTAVFEDSTCAVLRADPNKPHLLEVIATFHDAARARDYVRSESSPSDEHPGKRPATKQASVAKRKPASTTKLQSVTAAKPKPVSAAKPNALATDVSERQAAALKALRSLMDKKNRVEVTKGELAKAASIPDGSLHSVLVSLEKKGMIRTERQGSAKFRAIYEVLQTARKNTPSLNGVVRKEPLAKTIAQ
jgi:uncharacterized membrane protein